MSYIEFDINGKTLFDQERHTVRIMRCCEEYCSPDKKAEHGTRPFYALHFILCGKGVLRYESGGETKSVELKKGDAFLVYDGARYEYYPDKEKPWGYDWIDFTGENIADLFACCGFDREKPYITIHHFDSIRPTIRDLVEEFDASEVQNMKCSAYFMLLLSRLIDNASKQLLRNGESESKKLQRLRNILIYINNNYRLDLSVETIARASCVSPDYLKHLFSESIGMSLTEYLLRFRVSSACEIFIRNDLLGIEDVAAEVGYSDPKYFARVFKKIKGVSASEYRKNCKDDNPFQWLKDYNVDFR